jgi:hypothetical protein
MIDNNNEDINNKKNAKNGKIIINTSKQTENDGQGPFKNLPPNLKKQIIVVVVFIFLIAFFTIKGIVGNHSKKPVKTNATNSTLDINNSVLLQKQLDQKISQIANATANNTESIKQLRELVKQQQQGQGAEKQQLPELPINSNPVQSTPPPSPPPQQQITPPPAPPPPPPSRIQSITIDTNATQSNNSNIKKQENNNDNYVSLPNGSIVPVTIVSGIYAPITSGQTLPTVLNVDAMFYGPNHTRIPLKSCKVLADSQGDLATKRAFVNAHQLSCVLPNGKAESFTISGYLAAKQDSAYGIQGKIISVTGKYITGSFLAGVLQGFGQAMSMANQNSVVTSSGSIETSVNGGQVAKYSGYAGLAGGANALSQYYANKLNNLVDMIYVPAGTKAYLVVQKGAVITGYTVNNINHYGFKGVD